MNQSHPHKNSGRPKRHHFVPQGLQRRFTNTDGRLFAFNKRLAGRGVWETSPLNLFVEGDLYTAIADDGSKDIRLEHYYAELDAAGSAVIARIVDAARAGRRPDLSTEEKALWDLFLYTQWKRVPDVHAALSLRADFENTLAGLLREYEDTHRPLTARERLRLSDQSYATRLRENSIVKWLALQSAQALSGLAARGLGVARIARGGKSFVIGSHPVVKLTSPGHTHISDVEVEMWLAIASDVAVTLYGRTGEEKLVELSDDREIRRLNELVALQSTAFAGRSRALIESLARPYTH